MFVHQAAWQTLDHVSSKWTGIPLVTVHGHNGKVHHPRVSFLDVVSRYRPSLHRAALTFPIGLSTISSPPILPRPPRARTLKDRTLHSSPPGWPPSLPCLKPILPQGNKAGDTSDSAVCTNDHESLPLKTHSVIAAGIRPSSGVKGYVFLMTTFSLPRRPILSFGREAGGTKLQSHLHTKSLENHLR